MKDNLSLQAGEVIDSTVMEKAALLSFLEREIADADAHANEIEAAAALEKEDANAKGSATDGLPTGSNSKGKSSASLQKHFKAIRNPSEVLHKPFRKGLKTITNDPLRDNFWQRHLSD